MNSPKFHRSLFLMLLGISISVQAHTLSPDQYLIWGLDSQDVQIPVGSVITEAVLTIHDFVPSKARFNLHLLDNTAVGVQLGVKEQPGNIFDGFGTLLTGNASGGKWICRLSQINPANSPMRTIFGDSFKMTLSNGSEVSFSSGLLELMDYIGNGGGFGLGFSFTDVCTFSQITLDIFAKSHAGGYQEKVYSFQISQMYVYDPVSGTWVYQGGDGQSEWEIQEDDPYVPLTVTNCQVIAGETIGQDTLTISGTFDRVLSNLPQSSAIKTEIISFSDNTVIYSQDCNCSRDTVYNRFIWNYELPENQPGQITTLVVDFANRTFEVVATRVDLSGLSSPIQINLLVGSYLMTGQVDETIINGDELIPLRLMRGYQDQLRVSEVAVNKGQAPGTDTLTVCGEITTDNPGINLTNQKVIINWGDQPFVIPIGSFIQTKNLNKYACKVDVPGGFVDCLIDFDRCLFTINLSKASLDVASDRIKFMIRFAQFKQFEYAQVQSDQNQQQSDQDQQQSDQDQLRVTEAAVNKGQTPGTDTLTVCGEITTDNPGINLTNQKVIINWGDQPFVIPIGSFIQTKNLNKYACKVDVPGGFVDCLIDFDRCLFTINLSKASLDVASGRVKFMIRFAQFKQFEYVQM